MIYAGEWYTKDWFLKRPMKKLLCTLQLFVYPKTVYRTITAFLNTGDVKPCCLGPSIGSITLFPHEDYIIMDYLLCSPQMQLHEIANHVSNATGSAFGPRTLCRAVYRLRITRKKVHGRALHCIYNS